MKFIFKCNLLRLILKYFLLIFKLRLFLRSLSLNSDIFIMLKVNEFDIFFFRSCWFLLEIKLQFRFVDFRFLSLIWFFKVKSLFFKFNDFNWILLNFALCFGRKILILSFYNFISRNLIFISLDFLLLIFKRFNLGLFGLFRFFFEFLIFLRICYIRIFFSSSFFINFFICLF